MSPTADDFARVAESGIEPPCASPELDLPRKMRESPRKPWRKVRAVPRLYPLPSLVLTLFTKGRSRRAFRLPGPGGGSFPSNGGTFAGSYLVSKGELINNIIYEHSIHELGSYSLAIS